MMPRDCLALVYSTCIHCNAPLGQNEMVEHFPIGRRLAYDAEKGRLWVVCKRCDRWNLTPLEERWEAIEEAERLYRGTRLRMSTEHIGLARLRDGTDLVRIGTPQRPEMAAWRYGDQFARRRRRILTGSVVGLAGLGTASLLLPVGGLAGMLVAGAVGSSVAGMLMTSMGLTRSTAIFKARLIPDGQGAYLVVGQNELASVRLFGDAKRWGLRVPYTSRRPTLDGRWTDWVQTGALHEATLRGDAALEAARRLLPLVNGAGARRAVVSEAVGLLDTWGNAEQVFAYAGSQVRAWSAVQAFGDTGGLAFLPPAVRLALEMSAHEDQERRALAGELAELERAWKDAEEIAAIADDLLVSGPVAHAFDRLRKRVRG